jgi:hypothetical protein
MPLRGSASNKEESVQERLMPFRFFDRGSIPFNGNLLSRCPADDHVLGGPRFHEFSHTRFGTIQRPNAGAAMGSVSVNPENVEWKKHLFDRGTRPQTARTEHTRNSLPGIVGAGSTRGGTNQFLGHKTENHIVTGFLLVQFHDAQLCGFEVWRGFHPHRYSLRISFEDVVWCHV